MVKRLMRMRRRKLVRFTVFSGLVLGALALALATRRGPRRPRAALQTPAGGVAPAESSAPATGADAAAIVEDGRRYAVRSWSFPLERYDLRIEDVGMSTALDAVLSRTNADFVVNGGFFDPTGRPVGLAMSDGEILSKLGARLSGGVLTSDGARAQLFATEGFTVPDGGRFAVQCRPRLVVDGAPNIKSDDTTRAERTALCIRDAGRTVDVAIVRGSDDGESAGPSLFSLARHLAAVGCEAALNLDGGPSTGAAWREGGEVRLLAPRGPIRHVIAFRERR
jgi:uncharacterized protein YigE (DUF2233 family)